MQKGRRGGLRLWFALTSEERVFLAGILLIALIGLTARYLYLRGQRPEPYTPPPAAAHAEGRP